MRQLTNHEQESQDLTRILPASQKVYIQGSSSDIQVPMREICLSDTPEGLGHQKNAPIMVYDTSDAYTDPKIKIDLNQGLPHIRQSWIEKRQDTQQLTQLSSAFGHQRLRDIRTANIRFAHIQHPRCAQ